MITAHRECDCSRPPGVAFPRDSDPVPAAIFLATQVDLISARTRFLIHLAKIPKERHRPEPSSVFPREPQRSMPDSEALQDSRWPTRVCCRGSRNPVPNTYLDPA